MPTPPQKDLIILVADLNAKFALVGLLARGKALEIRAVNYDIYVHLEKDPGTLLRASSFLRPYTNKYEHALVIFDRDGCGREHLSREELEVQVERNLSQNGWGDRASAVVVDPELEAWVWSDSPHVDRLLGWATRTPPLRDWLLDKAFLGENDTKPGRPKEALQLALRIVKKPRSSSLYETLAGVVSLQRCTDPAFDKLKCTLREWFPVS